MNVPIAGIGKVLPIIWPVGVTIAAIATAYAALAALRRRRARKQAEELSALAQEVFGTGPEPKCAPSPLTAPTCPSCHAQLKKTPKRKTKCHSCGEAIYVRSGQLLSLEQVVDWDERQAEGLTPNRESKLLAAMPVVTHAQFLQLPPQEQWKYFWVPRLDNEKWIAKAKKYTQWLAMGGSSVDALGRFLLSTKQYTEVEAQNVANYLHFYVFLAMKQRERRELQEMQDAFPYWKYLSMGDEKVRTSHAALNGLILPADDPFWRDHFPPWELGCRCQVVGVTQEEYDGAQSVGDFNPADPDAKAEGWKLSPKGLKMLHNGVLDDGSGLTISIAVSPVDMKMILGTYS